jgi:ferric-dicitrate binding protein FerR (iron transport regulator)
LVYSSSFTGKKREVYLIGEGFFEVADNEEIPFVVQTADLNVEALGTKFNLSAYAADSFIETVLVEGKVRLMGKGNNPFAKDFILEPNQLAVFNRGNKELKIKEVNIVNHVSWHEGFLNFDSSDLNRIVKKLERYYNINIILKDPMLGVRTISGKLKLKEEKENVLKVLANTSSAELVRLNETTYELK